LAPVSTRISPEVNLLSFALTVSPFLSVTNLFWWRAINCAIALWACPELAEVGLLDVLFVDIVHNSFQKMIVQVYHPTANQARIVFV
jgi:hypothetical protein